MYTQHDIITRLPNVYPTWHHYEVAKCIPNMTSLWGCQMYTQHDIITRLPNVYPTWHHYHYEVAKCIPNMTSLRGCQMYTQHDIITRLPNVYPTWHHYEVAKCIPNMTSLRGCQMYTQHDIITRLPNVYPTWHHYEVAKCIPNMISLRGCQMYTQHDIITRLPNVYPTWHHYEVAKCIPNMTSLWGCQMYTQHDTNDVASLITGIVETQWKGVVPSPTLWWKLTRREPSGHLQLWTSNLIWVCYWVISMNVSSIYKTESWYERINQNPVKFYQFLSQTCNLQVTLTKLLRKCLFSSLPKVSHKFLGNFWIYIKEIMVDAQNIMHKLLFWIIGNQYSNNYRSNPWYDDVKRFWPINASDNIGKLKSIFMAHRLCIIASNRSSSYLFEFHQKQFQNCLKLMPVAQWIQVEHRYLRTVLGWGTKWLNKFTKELELIMWSVVINDFGICYV